MKVKERKEIESIIARAETLRSEAILFGFDKWRPAYVQPIGVYDLWASADKAVCNAQMALQSKSGAGLADARGYLRDAETSYLKVIKYGRPKVVRY